MRALRPAALLLATAAVAGCASGSPGEGAPEPGTLPPLPAPRTAALEPGAPEAAGLAGRIAAGEHAAAYVLTLETLELCGARPFGQQALLLLAASELDPRNPEPRLPVALEATRIVIEATERGTWTRSLAESLHLIAQRLGAREAPDRGDAEALRQSSWTGLDRSRAGGSSPSSGGRACDPLPWPAGAGTGGEPPSLEGTSYPATIVRLRLRLAEQEKELDRLRRIAREP